MSQICLMTKAWRSGSAWVAQMIAQAIAEQGATITFIAPLAEPVSREPRHALLKRVVTPRELTGHHPKVVRIAASLKRIAASLRAVLKARLDTKSFVFSIPEPLVFTLPLLLALRLSGARVLFIVHDAQPHAWSLPKAMRRLEHEAHAWSYRLSNVVVALTPTVRSALADDFKVPVGKIVVIPHGPFVVGDVPPIPGNHQLLVFGSLRRNKSVLEVVRGVLMARRQGLSVRLLLVGEPLRQELGYWEECLASMAEDQEAFDVRTGFFPDEDLPLLIASVDAFVLAYQNFDSQSGVAILAALAGRPIIGTRAGGLGELFDLGMAGQIVAEAVSPASIAAAIIAFYDLPKEHWRSEAALASAMVHKQLRWDLIAAQYLAVIRNEAPMQP